MSLPPREMIYRSDFKFIALKVRKRDSRYILAVQNEYLNPVTLIQTYPYLRFTRDFACG